MGASNVQGQGKVTITFVSDGTWKATTIIGSTIGMSSGTSWLVGDQVVLDGVAANGSKIRYTLKERQGAEGREMWGMVEASFGHAMLSLKRAS